MKYYYIILALLLSSGIASAQIGVNTNKPTANLDVNGTMRVRSLELKQDGFQAKGTVLYIVGVDEKGNLIPIELDENIILDNNRLKVKAPESSSSLRGLPENNNLSDLYSGERSGSSEVINDLDLGIVILPGGGRDRPVIKLENGTNTDKVEITGFKSAPDGTMVYLYPTSESIKIRPEHAGSREENRVMANGVINIKKNEMLLMMYDAALSRWVVASSN